MITAVLRKRCYLRPALLKNPAPKYGRWRIWVFILFFLCYGRMGPVTSDVMRPKGGISGHNIKKKAAYPNTSPATFRGGIFSKVRDGNNIFSAKRRLLYGLLFFGGFMSRWIIIQLLQVVGSFFRQKNPKNNTGVDKITSQLKSKPVFKSEK